MPSIFPYLRYRYGPPVPPLSMVRSSELPEHKRFTALLPAKQPARTLGKSVTVVGGGFAGLTAAVLLRTDGFEVTVLEARPDVGGRVWSRTDICKGRVIEAGAELIGANHRMWLSFANTFSLGLSVLTSDDQFAGANLGIPLKLKGQVLSEAEAEKLYKEMDVVLHLISKDAATIIDPYKPWRSPDAPTWDKTSVAVRLQQLGVDPTGLLYALLSANLSNDQVLAIDQQSYLGLLALVRGGQMGDDDMAYWTQTEVYRCAKGNQSLAFALRDLLKTLGGTVLTSTTVTAIDVGNATVKITAGGRTYDSDYAVLAIPQPTWGSITISPVAPPIPGSDHIATGPAVKYLSPVKGRFWLESRLAPTSVSDDLGMTWEGTDNQMVVGDQGFDLSVFAGGPCAEAARKAVDKRTYFTTGLSSMYSNYAGHIAADGFFIDWPSESTIRCGYSCPKVGQVTTAAPLLDQLYQGRLAFAGEHTVAAFFGYMEGALQSGAFAADRIKTAAGID